MLQVLQSLNSPDCLVVAATSEAIPTSQSMATVAYVAAAVLFILSLAGLSKQTTARQGNWLGMIGMSLAIVATVVGVMLGGYVWMLLAIIFGRLGSVGLMFVFFGMIMMPRWLEQVRDFCADVAAVSTTFDPTSLAQAMRKLAVASTSSHNLELGGRLLPVSPFLVMARREKLNTTMGWENSPRTWSSTDEVRLELLLRADRAEAMASGANPEEFTGKEYRKRWKQLGRSSETVKPE